MNTIIKTNHKYDSLLELLSWLKKENIPESDHKKYVDRFLEFKAREKAVPLHVQFELTSFCNLNCKMCYVHVDETAIKNNNQLTSTQWKSIMSEAHSMGMIRATLTGGECLTYPDFEELYLHLRNMGIETNILTNGVLLNEEKIAFFCRYQPKSIRVTLYGSNNDAYEKVTGKRFFDVVINNIYTAKAAGLPISLAITPNRFMFEDARPLIEKAEETGLPYEINSGLITPREMTSRALEDLSIEEYIQIYQIRRELRSETLEPVDPMELPDVGYGKERKVGIKCGAGRSSFTVTADGKMCACSSLYDINADIIANGLENAWKIVNEKSRSYPVPSECDDCIYKEKCIQCIAFHRNSGSIGHCNPLVCERTKKLIEVGFMKLPI